MIRQIVASVQGHTPVEARGATVPHAVRVAAHLLGLGPGRTVLSERTDTGWIWDWSGHRIVVDLVPAPPSGWVLAARIALHGVSRWDLEQLLGGADDELVRSALRGEERALRICSDVVRMAREVTR